MALTKKPKNNKVRQASLYVSDLNLMGEDMKRGEMWREKFHEIVLFYFKYKDKVGKKQ